MGEVEKYDEKEAFLKDFESLRPDFFLSKLYEDKDQLAKAADEIRPQKTKTSLFSAIPMDCKGPNCTFAESCPLQKDGIAPIGNPCPIEMALVSQFMESFMRELNVDPSNMIEVSMVRDLVDQEVQQMRATKLLAREDFIQENIVGIDDSGRPIMKKEMHLAVELTDKLLKRKKDIRNQMMATREQKAKVGLGQLDTSQVISNMMDTIRDVERKKEKELLSKLGMEHVDDYVEKDKAKRDNIIDAEIVEES